MTDADLEKAIAAMIYPRSWAPGAPDTAGVRADRVASLDKARRIIAAVREASPRLV